MATNTNAPADRAAINLTARRSSVRAQRVKAAVASTIGTPIEWYDFFLYGAAAALVFPTVFSPGESALAGTLFALSTQFVGFAARPVGAANFGHYGDPRLPPATAARRAAHLTHRSRGALRARVRPLVADAPVVR